MSGCYWSRTDRAEPQSGLGRVGWAGRCWDSGPRTTVRSRPRGSHPRVWAMIRVRAGDGETRGARRGARKPSAAYRGPFGFIRPSTRRRPAAKATATRVATGRRRRPEPLHRRTARRRSRALPKPGARTARPGKRGPSASPHAPERRRPTGGCRRAGNRVASTNLNRGDPPHPQPVLKLALDAENRRPLRVSDGAKQNHRLSGRPGDEGAPGIVEAARLLYA